MRADETQVYVVAAKRGQPLRDVQEVFDALERRDGVSVLGSTGSRAQIQATAQAIAKLREELGGQFYIEPAVPRDHA